MSLVYYLLYLCNLPHISLDTVSLQKKLVVSETYYLQYKAYKSLVSTHMLLLWNNNLPG